MSALDGVTVSRNRATQIDIYLLTYYVAQWLQWSFSSVCVCLDTAEAVGCLSVYVISHHS